MANNVRGIIVKFSIVLLFLVASLFVVSLPNVQNNVSADDDLSCYFKTAEVQNDITLRSHVDFTKSNLNSYSVFVGQVVNLTLCSSEQITDVSLKSDSQIIFVDGTSDLLNPSIYNNVATFTKQVKCNVAGEYNITLIGKKGGEIYFDSLHLIVFQDIKNVSIVPSDDFIDNNQEVTFDFVYNDRNELLNSGNVKVSFLGKNDEIVVNNDDFSQFYAIKSLNSNSMVIDTSKLNDDWQDFDIVVTANGKDAKYTMQVLDLTKPSTALLSTTSVTYYLHDLTAYYYIYLDKNSKPIISLIDNSGSIEIAGISKVESDIEDFDKIAIKLNLLNTIDFTNVLFVIDGINGDIYRSIGVSVIDTINSVVVRTDKVVYANKEDVKFNVVVNGKEDYASSVRWFVKDIEIEGTNATLDLVKDGGTYSVYAIVGGLTSNTAVVIIKYSTTRQMFWYILLLVSILGIVILTITRKKKNDIDVFKPLNENIDEVIACTKLLAQKYTRRNAIRLYRDVAIIRERCYKAYIENEEHLYKIASQNLQKATRKLKYLAFSKRSSVNRAETMAEILVCLEDANDALLEYKRICTMG